MQTINVTLGKDFQLEACTECLGLFFDPSELDGLMDEAAREADRPDTALIEALAEQDGATAWPTAYVKCPVCSELMQRKAFGVRSGVIVDSCKPHGAWLDGGELSKLLAWARAGGVARSASLLRRRQEEEANRAAAAARLKARHGAVSGYAGPNTYQTVGGVVSAEVLVAGLVSFFTDPS
jgi:Zn-finger nucleic acid-binding protein